MREQDQLPSGVQLFTVAYNLAVWFISSLAVFSSLSMRKFGTVGTRSYGKALLGGIFIMAVLSASSVGDDHQAFNLGIWWMVVMYFLHLSATRRRRRFVEHVHSYHIGEPRFFRGTRGYTFELVLASWLACVFVWLGAGGFGVFILVSTVCSMILVGALEERDRGRGYAMADALLDQERLAEIYEQTKWASRP